MISFRRGAKTDPKWPEIIKAEIAIQVVDVDGVMYLEVPCFVCGTKTRIPLDALENILKETKKSEKKPIYIARK